MKKLALLLLLAVASIARAEDVIRLDSGSISGTTSKKNDVRIYKGIPFAKPPVGELRWKAPERPEPWKGVRACTTFGAACPQPEIPIFKIPEEKSEDCLYLNVWTAAKDANAKLPVMVWIHGGSYAFGSGAQSVYDGEGLARRGVVLVTINYRLGPFGFLAHPALSKESGKGSGAYGFLDQVAALEWVQRNIAAFGGDPKCVTVFGESAGAGAVTALLLSPLAKGLFHRAIAQSGVIFARPLADGEATGERLAKKLGCEGADALAALRAKTPKEILDAASISANLFGEGGIPFAPVIDGRFLPRDPIELLAAQHDVPLMLGSTADEGTIFVYMNPGAATKASFEKFVTASFGGEAARVLELYPCAKDEDARGALSKLAGDAYFVAPIRLFARSRASLGSKTFMYHFTRVPPPVRLLGLGAHHAAELAYVFETLPPNVEGRDHELAAAMAEAWARFAKTGDPNGGTLPSWPAYAASSDEHLELGDKVKKGSGLHREACDLLSSVWANLRRGMPAKKYY